MYSVHSTPYWERQRNEPRKKKYKEKKKKEREQKRKPIIREWKINYLV